MSRVFDSEDLIPIFDHKIVHVEGVPGIYVGETFSPIMQVQRRFPVPGEMDGNWPHNKIESFLRSIKAEIKPQGFIGVLDPLTAVIREEEGSKWYCLEMTVVFLGPEGSSLI